TIIVLVVARAEGGGSGEAPQGGGTSRSARVEWRSVVPPTPSNRQGGSHGRRQEHGGERRVHPDHRGRRPAGDRPRREDPAQRQERLGQGDARLDRERQGRGISGEYAGHLRPRQLTPAARGRATPTPPHAVGRGSEEGDRAPGDGTTGPFV